MVFAESGQMAKAVARVAESRNVRRDRAACRGLLAKVLLNNVITVKPVALSKFDVNIRRSLIERHIRQRASREARKISRGG